MQTIHSFVPQLLTFNILSKLNNMKNISYIVLFFYNFSLHATQAIVYVNFDKQTIYSEQIDLYDSTIVYKYNSYKVIGIENQDTFNIAQSFTNSSLYYNDNTLTIRFYIWIDSNPLIDIQPKDGIVRFNDLKRVYSSFQINNFFNLTIAMKDNLYKNKEVFLKYSSKAETIELSTLFHLYSEHLKWIYKKPFKNKIKYVNDILNYYELYYHFKWIYNLSNRFEKSFHIRKSEKVINKWVIKNERVLECDIPINSELIFDMKKIEFVTQYNNLRLFETERIKQMNTYMEKLLSYRKIFL